MTLQNNAPTIAGAAQAAESALQSNADRLVQREVIVCLSHMVSTLAGGYGELSRGDLCGLAEQASDLCNPIPDYEEAATQAGWTFQAYAEPLAGCTGYWFRACTNDEESNNPEDSDHAFPIMSADDAEGACSIDNLDPYEREVYEHWAVSTWLAEKLEAKGERVDTDFSNLNVWARTTTGQAISMDSVIREITTELHAA